tara:strand:- start:1154 stop:1960 length:807 start_codon:yes stop_codon:yes gene_type:complete
MSVDLSFGRQWENAKPKLFPPGHTGSSVTVVGELLTCTSVVGESAKMTKYTPVRAGETVAFTVLARVVNEGDTGSIAIDYPQPGNLLTMRTIDSTEFEEYTISANIDLAAPEDSIAVFQIGLFSKDQGTVEYILPKIAKDNSQLGSAQSLASGLLYFDQADNLPKINNGFCNHGIYDLSFAANVLTVTIDKSQRVDPEAGSERIPVLPIITVQMTLGGQGSLLTAQAGNYDNTTGEFEIQFFNSAGAVVNPTSYLGSGNIFFTVKAEV